MFFFFPVWHNLKKYVIVYRSLEGIHAVATGIILSGLFYLLQAISFSGFDTALWIEVFVVTSTFLMLQFTKIPAPVIVLLTFSLGYLL
jgi:chromate transporter